MNNFDPQIGVTMPSAIQISDLTFQYPDSQHLIFSGLDWEVAEGDFWVIIGPNGSGKTSLIRLLLGLEYPDAGSITVFGQQLKKTNSLNLTAADRSARSKIGHVPQHLQFDHRLPISVLDVVEGGTLPFSFWRSLVKGSSLQLRHEISMEALAQVTMEDWAKKRFSLLSSGQKQRVLIARALATQSPILILDEPTASVDPIAAQEIVQICQQLRKKHTILFVSHDISMIPEICEFILCLRPASSAQLSAGLQQAKTAYYHDVCGMSCEEMLLLLYGHLAWPSSATTKPSRPCE